MAFCVPSITVDVDDDLEARREKHPEINWSEVTRQPIEERIDALELMEELTSESEPTGSGVREIVDEINRRGRIDEESA